MAKEIVLDMSQEVTPAYLSRGKRKKRTRKSYPSESVFKKRKRWWIEHDFGEEAAEWAASWRLGLPMKKGRKKDWEQAALDRAIKLADRRVAEVAYRMRKFGETKEEAIKHLDEELRKRDKDQKVKGGLVEPDISIYHKKIKPNIFKALSP